MEAEVCLSDVKTIILIKTQKNQWEYYIFSDVGQDCLALNRKVCVERGSLAIFPFRGSPVSHALQPSSQHRGLIYRPSGGRWLSSKSLHGCEFLILVTVKSPYIAEQFFFYFFCRKEYSLVYSMLALFEPSVQYAKGSLAQRRLREISPLLILSGGTSHHLSESRGGKMKAATVPVCFLCTAVAGPVPSTFSHTDFILCWTNVLQLVPCKHKGVRTNSSHSRNLAAAPIAYSLSMNSRNIMKWRSRPRKQDYCRWLRWRWYFLAEPILAFYNTDELMGLTLMK